MTAATFDEHCAQERTQNGRQKEAASTHAHLLLKNNHTHRQRGAHLAWCSWSIVEAARLQAGLSRAKATDRTTSVESPHRTAERKRTCTPTVAHKQKPYAQAQRSTKIKRIWRGIQSTTVATANNRVWSRAKATHSTTLVSSSSSPWCTRDYIQSCREKTSEREKESVLVTPRHTQNERIERDMMTRSIPWQRCCGSGCRFPASHTGASTEQQRETAHTERQREGTRTGQQRKQQSYAQAQRLPEMERILRGTTNDSSYKRVSSSAIAADSTTFVQAIVVHTKTRTERHRERVGACRVQTQADRAHLPWHTYNTVAAAWTTFGYRGRTQPLE